MKTILRSRLLWLMLPALVIAAVGPWWLSAYYLGVLTMAYYFGVFAMSWDLLFGYAGMVNFGPTFLIGLGAYGAALLDTYAGAPIVVCLIFGGLMSIIGGILLALPALKLRGAYFGLVTLVAVLLLRYFIVIFSGFTGGEIGMMVPDILSIDTATNYEYALWFMAASALILVIISRSSLGLILEATGQDPIAAAALGFNVAKHRLAAFCISALFSGLAGGMMVFYSGTASVGTVIDISIGVQIIIAAVVGGRRTILGAMIGSIVILLADELLRPLGQLNIFVVSGICLAVIIVFPGGLLGLMHRQREGA
ncbi:branched-chain amino acid ABC transporter permease [Acidimangrovimonas sediminis]|uniref:branched-chain amino acid ABC transporter permease n=1 Tax=Acidimangrovimonas sediminis TaxID=2056283 RepID=UPI000C809A45|nr:branched-chain amino acid ABC transporter permease [Acidimangrovimonas sediminis]